MSTINDWPSWLQSPVSSLFKVQIGTSGLLVNRKWPEMNFSFLVNDWVIYFLKNQAYDIQHRSLTRAGMQLVDIPILFHSTFMGFKKFLDESEPLIQRRTNQSVHFETQPGNRDVEEIILNQIIFDLITFKGVHMLYSFWIPPTQPLPTYSDVPFNEKFIKWVKIE